MPRLPNAAAFAAAVADLTRNDQLLLVELDGAAGLAQVSVGMAQVAQRIAFPAAVADLTHNDQLLLVQLDGAAGLAQGSVGNAQVAQRSPFPAAVADLTRNDQLPARTARWRGGSRPGQRRPVPRLPSALPSPRRSPISRAMTSSCSYSSMARRVSPRSA